MSLNNSESEQELTILINTKYARITVHRKTLKALGEPAYIKLGYNFQDKILILFGADKPAQNTIRVALNKNGVCFIHSKSFMEGLITVSEAMNEQGTYLLKGETDKKLSAVSFSLANAEKCVESADRGSEQ